MILDTLVLEKNDFSGEFVPCLSEDQMVRLLAVKNWKSQLDVFRPTYLLNTPEDQRIFHMSC
jgi:hypothetical protein